LGDAIVIGSGPNGLAAAIRLAEAGRSVLVLESAGSFGGAVRTEELTLPGFHHDTFAAVHPAGAASPVWGRMPLLAHGLEWVHPSAPMAHPLPGGHAAVLERDVGATAASLDALSPGDGAAWARYIGPFVRAPGAVQAAMLAGFPPVGGALRLLGRVGPRRLLWLPGPAAALARHLFAGAGARAWLYGTALHGDMPPPRGGSGVFGVYLNLLGHLVGWPSPRGGAQRLTDALVSYLRSLGGELRADAPVDRVLAAGGRVRGVGLAGGETLAAPLVIATVMPHALLRMAGDALPAWYRAGLRAYVAGPGTMKLDWALDGPIPWVNAAVRGAGTVHVGGDEREVLAAAAAARRGLPERPFLLLGQQTVADPSRAPAGRHTAWAYTHGPAGADWRGHAERMEAHVERYAPGFRDRVLARHVLGPADLQARDPNLVGGDVGAGSYRLRQLLFRPVPSLTPYATPLAGLFLGGASTFPGASAHGVPGDAAARAALARS
jgi:phytoene dehydrogenase-like protein